VTGVQTCALPISFTAKDYTTANFTPRSPIVNVFPWEGTTGVNPKTVQAAGMGKIVRTEYYNLNGQRLASRNGTVIAPANSIVVAHRTDGNGIVHSSRIMIKN
jgi:hypothetical protein